MGIAISPRGDMLKYRVQNLRWTHHADSIPDFIRKAATPDRHCSVACMVRAPQSAADREQYPQFHRVNAVLPVALECSDGDRG